MRSKFLHLRLILLAQVVLLISGCNSSKSIYKSSTSKKDYLTINAVTLTHCGCAEIYAENFKEGKKDFQIFYTDNSARKTIYTYSSNGKVPEMEDLLATQSDDYTTPFNDLDIKIFSIIDSAIAINKGIIYPIRRTIYKGYIADTSIRR